LSRYRSEREEKLLEQILNQILVRTEKIADIGVLGVPANSGGIVLSSGEIIAVTIKALARNSGDIYIGGNESGILPYSGHGFLLEPGEAVSFEVENLNTIRLVSIISGDQVTWASLK